MLFLITNQSNCFTLFVLKLGGDTTVAGNYVILHGDKVVDKLLRSEEFYTNDIEDIKWYKDSVKFKYIVNCDAPQMVYEKVYKFPKME